MFREFVFGEPAMHEAGAGVALLEVTLIFLDIGN
jgi:hypothetical protein